MASKIILCVLLAVASVVLASDDPKYRGNIAIGDTIGAHLIYHEIHYKYGIPLIRRDETITVKGIDNEIIKAVFVSDLQGGGESYIINGGIGRDEVSIKLESGERGSGYKFMVEVYAI